MCLVGIAWASHARYPLIIAGNRDEYHARPSAAADWWRDAGQVFGGRDLVAGGSWLGVSRSGRVAVVTNHPGRPPAPEYTASRGHLVRDFLAGTMPAAAFVAGVQRNAHRYAGFCLIAGTAAELHGAISPAGSHPSPWRLQEGVWAISNSPLEAPWLKAGYLEARLEDLLQEAEIREEDLFSLLARREPVGDPPLPDAGRERIHRTPFVIGSEYGTRSSTVVLMDRDGRCRVVERRFDPAGQLTGDSRIEFATSGA
jgi:uncharacterized protein with NRDE domain